MVQLPILSARSSRWTMRVTLDGQRYTIGVNWNAREQAWYIDLADGAGNPVCMGIKACVDIPLWMQYKGEGGFPPGDLVLVDTLSNLQTATPGYSDLGQRYLLIYVEQADVISGAA